VQIKTGNKLSMTARYDFTRRPQRPHSGDHVIGAESMAMTFFLVC
jgi:hypothetical protein